MVYLNEDIKIGKKGVSYVTTIVDECMCSFHKIEQENDVGIDGQIELFDERRLPIGKLISVQVKTGRSYYDLDKNECHISIGTDREYWMKIDMPVIGIVCVMDEKYESVKTAFWVDIKEYLLKISYAYYHPDHWLTKGRHEFSEESKKYVQQKVKMFSEEDIMNVLTIIEEHYFDRGSLGQTAEIIIRNASNSENKLLNIILNSEIDDDMRYDAEVILAYQNKEYYMQNIKEITCMDSECTELIVKYINDFGYFDLY